MSLESIVALVGAAFLPILGYFLKTVIEDVKELKADLTKLSVELPKTYVTRDDYREDIKGIKEMLGKIFDKLENKADKV